MSSTITSTMLAVLMLVAPFVGACQPAVAPAAVASSSVLAIPQVDSDESPLTLLGHFAGPMLSLAIQGDTAYLGHSFELNVVDISTPDQPRLLSSLPIPATQIVLDGNGAYVGGRKGFFVLDVRVPTSPILLSTLTYPTPVADVAVTAGYAALIEGDFLHIIDVSDLAQIHEVGAMVLPRQPESLTMLDERVYLTDYGGVRIVDIHNPRRPLLSGSIKTDAGPSKVTFDGQDGYFVSKGIIYRFSSAEPTKVVAINETAFSYWVRNLTIVDGLAFLSAGSAGLRIWDVSERNKAVEIGSYRTAGLALANDAAQNKLFLVDCDDGLLVIDVDDPTEPHVVGMLPILGALSNVAVADGFVYATSGFNSRLHLLDARDPTLANALIRHLTTQRVDAFAIANNRALLLADDTLFIRVYSKLVTRCGILPALNNQQHRQEERHVSNDRNH